MASTKGRRADVDLFLLVAAAADAGQPDSDWALDKLREWAQAVYPSDRALELRSVLVAQRGSVLEPYALGPRSLEIAVSLASICFAAGADRVRIGGDLGVPLVVPSEFSERADDRIWSIIASTGLVVTRMHKSYLVHRYPLMRPHRSPASKTWFCPSLASGIVTIRRAGSATAELSSAGVVIRVKGAFRSWESAFVRSESVGWNVILQAGSLVLKSDSPERLLAQMAACERRDLLEISPAGQGKPKELCLLQLEPLEETEVPLWSAQLRAGRLALDCLSVQDLNSDSVLEAADARRLANSFVLPIDWFERTWIDPQSTSLLSDDL